MEEEKDQVTITLMLTRNTNGTITSSRKIEGKGIHLYELVGLLNIAAYQFAQDSMKTAKDVPETNQQN